MKRLGIFALTVCMMTLLSACNFDVTAELNVADIRKAALDQQSDLMTSATLEVFVPESDQVTLEQCEERKKELVEELKEHVSIIEVRGCENLTSDIFIQIDIEIPIVSSMSEWENANSLLGILTLIASDSKSVDVFVVNNLEKFEELWARYLSIIVKLINGDQAEMIFIQDVFLNNDPVVSHQKLELTQQSKNEIGLSNVSTRYLEENGKALVFSLEI